MKKIPRAALLTSLSFLFALAMLCFTFFDWGWFSGQTGWIARWTFPMGFEESLLSMVSDFLWLLAPFFSLFALVLKWLSRKKSAEAISLFLFTLPLSVYSVLEFILALAEKKELPFALVGLYAALIALGLFTVVSAFESEGVRITAHLALFHAAMQGVLVVLSFFLKERLSPFYFSQLLPVGFRFTYLLVSTFFYYFFYSLSLACFLYAKKHQNSSLEDEKKAS